MCNAVSFIVTRNDVFHSMSVTESESHSRLAKQHGFVNDEHEIRYVAVEITPPDYNFQLPYKKWIFTIDQDLVPDWFNMGEVEIACREKLPLWKELHIIDDDGGEHVIGEGCYGIVTAGSPKITMNRGCCYTYNKSTPIITMNGGCCYTYNNSTPIITMNGGVCYTYNESTPTITMNNGRCYTCNNSTPTITMNGGDCITWNKSTPAIIDNRIKK